MNDDRSHPGDLKQQFDLLHNHLSEIQRTIVENTAKVTGFLLLAMGWLATSSGARDYLKTHLALCWVGSAAVVGTLAAASLASWLAYRASDITFQRLVALDYLPTSCYDIRRVGARSLVLYIAGNVFLGGLLIVVLFNVD
jgi:hypothetical protein